MAWQGRRIVAQDGLAKSVIDKIEQEFDGLNEIESLSAKITITDAKHEEAMGFLFFNEDHQDRELPGAVSSGHWSAIKFEENDDWDDLISRVAQKLNEIENTSFEQAFWAKFIGCNAKHDTGYFSHLIPPR